MIGEKYRVSGNSSTKKKIKYLGHFVTKSNNLLLNEREIFKVLFDTKSFCIYCSKVSTFTSIQNLSLFTILWKTFSNISFFIALIPCSILSVQSAVSLTIVLYTFVLMYLHRKKNQVALSLENMVPKNETVNRQNYLQMLKNYFYPTMQRKRLNNKMIFQQDDAPPIFPKFVHGWMKNLMEDGLVEVVQLLGHYTLQIQRRLIFFSMEIH